MQVPFDELTLVCELGCLRSLLQHLQGLGGHRNATKLLLTQKFGALYSSKVTIPAYEVIEKFEAIIMQGCNFTCCPDDEVLEGMTVLMIHFTQEDCELLGVLCLKG